MRPKTSKPVKWLIWIGIALVLLTATAVAVTAVVLPSYVEQRLIPRLSREFGLNPGDIQVRRIGLWGSDLGPIRLMAEDGQALSIGTVQVDYSPMSLMQKKIRAITIGGLVIPVTVSSDGASIAGINIPATATNEDDAQLDLRHLLPIELNRLTIQQSVLALQLHERRFTIPFEVELLTSKLVDGRLEGQTNLAFLGNPMFLQVSVNQAADRVRLEMGITDFQLDGLGAFFSGPHPVQSQGLMDLEGTAIFGLRAFDLKGLALTGRLNAPALDTRYGKLLSAIDADGRPQPVAISLSGDPHSGLKWRFAPFQISGPAQVKIDDLFGTLSQNQGLWALKGNMKTVIPKQQLPARFRIPKRWSSSWQMTVHHLEGDRADFELIRKRGGPLTVRGDDLSLSAQKQAVRISGTLKKGMLDAKGAVSVKGIHIATPDGKIQVPELKVEGSMGLPLSDAGTPRSLEGRAGMTGIRGNLGTTAARLPKMTFHLTGKEVPGQQWHFDGRLKLSNGRLADLPRQARIRNLSIDLPLKWPETKGVSPGRLRIGAIEWKGRDVGGVKGVLRQKNQRLTLALTHNSKLFPGMRVLINGGIDRGGSAIIEARAPHHQLVGPIDLGRFHSAATGMMVSGQVEAAANLTIINGRLAGDAHFDFDQGRLHQPSRNLLLEGVDMKLHLDDMHKFQSAPQQKMTVDHVTFGNLKAQKLNVDFQLEYPGTLFVEKAQIDWSEGKINVAAIRIVPGVDVYNVILFCDRLNLAMVLEQLGAAQAKGEGSVNGRVPIRWANGRLSFDNGFLFSSPGQTGAIQLTGTEVLLSGLPPGTPQHAQLDIATEALKDYTYKWAKLAVQTEDDILLLKLQFDGKPNRLLPFAYDQKLGQFKRVAGQGQADFKGISIDLNLRSPLNEILNYKELLR